MKTQNAQIARRNQLRSKWFEYLQTMKDIVKAKLVNGQADWTPVTVEETLARDLQDKLIAREMYLLEKQSADSSFDSRDSEVPKRIVYDSDQGLAEQQEEDIQRRFQQLMRGRDDYL